MEREKGLRSCLLGFLLLVAAGFLGSLSWIVRLLGYIGIANGTAIIAGDNVWLQMVNRISVLAVAILVLLQILVVTGGPDFSMRMVSRVFFVADIVCMLVGLYKQKKEENK